MIWQIIHKQIQLGAVDKLRQVTIIFPPDVVVARLTPALKAVNSVCHTPRRTVTVVEELDANIGCNVTLPPRHTKKFLVTPQTEFTNNP